ncbi:hypothetical protein [Pseudomonas chlororaphis]|nr:hypothetical protein [Pseudomonas chlororaphis]
MLVDDWQIEVAPTFVLGIATVLVANFYPSNTYKTGVVAALVFPIKYVFFMMIGVAFNYHHRGLLSLEKLFALTVECSVYLATAALQKGGRSK